MSGQRDDHLLEFRDTVEVSNSPVGVVGGRGL